MKAFVRFGPEGTLLSDLAGQWATAREGRLSIPPSAANRLNVSASTELRTWIKLFEEFELEAADPADAELRAPGDLPSLGELLQGATGPSTLADLYSLLTASTVIAQRDDLAYLASLAGTADGVSKVYSFHPGDWGLHTTDPSISLCLYRLQQADKWIHRPFTHTSRPPMSTSRLEPDEQPLLAQTFKERVQSGSLPTELDPKLLAQRSDWMVRVWMGLPLLSSLPKETHISTYETEKTGLKHHPHLTLFWLFTHAFLGNQHRFEEVWAVSRSSADPWIKEARPTLRAWMRGDRARLGPLRYGDFQRIQEEISPFAPIAACESPPAVKIHIHPKGTTPGGDHPNYRPFMALFAQLENTRSLGVGFCENERKKLEEQMARLVIPAWLVLIDQSLAQASKVPDHHPNAGYGRILCRAALSSNLEDFEQALHEAGGTSNFGARRRDELWRAIASFSEEVSIQRLYEGAEMFSREAGDWIRTAPKAPWNLLLERDSLATHTLIAHFLLNVPQCPASAPLVVEAATAARNHNITRAVPGLRRVISGSFTPIEGHHRQQVMWTLLELDPQASDFLNALMGIVRLEWEATSDESESFARAMDMALVVGALLSIAPDHKEAKAIGASLIATFSVAFSPRRKLQQRLIFSLWALSLGIQDGEVQPLAPPLLHILELRPRVPPDRLQERFWAHLETVVTTLM